MNKNDELRQKWAERVANFRASGQTTTCAVSRPFTVKNAEIA